MSVGAEMYWDVCRGAAVIGCLGDFLLHYFFVRVACVRQGLLPIFLYVEVTYVSSGLEILILALEDLVSCDGGYLELPDW